MIRETLREKTKGLVMTGSHKLGPHVLILNDGKASNAGPIVHHSVIHDFVEKEIERAKSSPSPNGEEIKFLEAWLLNHKETSPSEIKK